MTKAALADFANRFWQFQREEKPMVAIQAGQPSLGDQLLRECPTDHARRNAWAKNARTELELIEVEGLGANDRATRSLLIRELDNIIRGFACGAHLRPSIYPMGPDFMLQFWANMSAVATLEDGQIYIARMRTIPNALAGVIETLREGVDRGYRYPKLVVTRAADQVRGTLAVMPEAHPFAQPLQRVASRHPALASLADEALTIITDQIYPALHAYADFIETELGAVARESNACANDVDGHDHYAHLISVMTTLELNALQIHATGVSEVERITGQMVQVAENAGYDDLDEFRRLLQTDNSQFANSAEDLREQIEILSKRIDARIPEFFGRTPRTTYGVQSIPKAIAEKMPPAYAQPNPADGSAAGIHWITSIPGKCPRYMHLPLALHEAWPGHLMHFALIQEMDHLPDFRRYGGLSYSACLEGWALYCEALGEEMGFYDTPQKRYGRLEMEMWRAVRLVVDTGIHALGWSRRKAVSYFKQHMAIPDSTIEAEVDRYIALPAQALAYQLGNLKFRELRARAEDQIGNNFRVRDFHDALMAAGPVTLPVLDDLITEWIARQQNRKSS